MRGRHAREALQSRQGAIDCESIRSSDFDILLDAYQPCSCTSTGVVVRGIGPSLAQFGLSPLLADPTLELHDGNGTLLVSNDNWQSDPSQAAQLTARGLGLQDVNESGIFVSLPPGAYTAIVAGKNNGTGIGLVEIYNVR